MLCPAIPLTLTPVLSCMQCQYAPANTADHDPKGVTPSNFSPVATTKLIDCRLSASKRISNCDSSSMHGGAHGSQTVALHQCTEEHMVLKLWLFINARRSTWFSNCGSSSMHGGAHGSQTVTLHQCMEEHMVLKLWLFINAWRSTWFSNCGSSSMHGGAHGIAWYNQMLCPYFTVKISTNPLILINLSPLLSCLRACQACILSLARNLLAVINILF